MLKFEGEKNKHEKGRIVINKIDFTARNLTSNAGIFLLFDNAKAIGIFELIDTDLVFDNESTNKIKMNHIKTTLCGHFIGIDKLERLKLLQGDPLVNEFDISVKEPDTVSRFLGNFSHKTTQMLRDINFKVFKVFYEVFLPYPILCFTRIVRKIHGDVAQKLQYYRKYLQNSSPIGRK
jgi:hypothetical protein